MNRKIDSAIVHCFASDFGDRGLIHDWHINPPHLFDEIGYHYVITNGHLKEIGRPYVPSHDGVVQQGRDINKEGAHCRGKNKTSVGICLIGNRHYTPKHLLVALPELLYQLCFRYDFPAKNIYPHSLFDNKKTCPNISPDAFQVLIDMVEAKLNPQ